MALALSIKFDADGDGLTKAAKTAKRDFESVGQAANDSANAAQAAGTQTGAAADRMATAMESVAATASRDLDVIAKVANEASAAVSSVADAYTATLREMGAAAAQFAGAALAVAKNAASADAAWTALEFTVAASRGGISGIKKEIAETVVETRLFGREAEKAGQAWSMASRAAAGVGISLSVASFIARSQEYVTASNAIRSAANDNAAAVEESLYRIAQASTTSYTGLASLTRSLSNLPGGMRETMDVVEATALAMATVPVNGAAASAAIIQFTQAMQSGVMRGDEFNSVMEQAPGLADALAKGLGVTRGELRGMAQDGQLTARAVSSALRSVLPDLRELGQAMEKTLSQSVQQAENALVVFAGRVDQRAGGSAEIADVLEDVTKRLESIGTQNAAVTILERVARVAGLAADAAFVLADNIGLIVGAWAAWSALKAVAGMVLFRRSLVTGAVAMNALAGATMRSGRVMEATLTAAGMSAARAQAQVAQLQATMSSGFTRGVGALGLAAHFGVSPLTIFTTALSAVGAAWALYSSRVTRAQAASESAAKAQETLRESVSAQAVSVEELISAYRDLSDSQREVEAFKLSAALADMTAAAEISKRALAEAFDLSSLDFPNDRGQGLRLAQEFEALSKSLATGKRDLGTWNQDMRAFADAVGGETREKILGLIDANRNLVLSQAPIAGQLEELQMRYRLLENPTDAVALAFFRMRDAANQVQAATLTLSDMDDGLARFVDKAAGAADAAPALRDLAAAMRELEATAIMVKAADLFAGGGITQAQVEAIAVAVQTYAAQGEKAFKATNTLANAFENKRAKLMDVVLGYVEANDAAKKYYETITSGGKGLSAAQIKELASLRDLGDALKAAEKSAGQLTSAMAGVANDNMDSSLRNLLDLSQAAIAYAADIETATAALEATTLGSAEHEAVTLALTDAQDQLTAAQAAYTKGVDAVSASVEAEITNQETANRIAELRRAGYADSSREIKALVAAQELAALATEREITLAALARQADGLEGAARTKRLAEIAALTEQYETLWAVRKKSIEIKAEDQDWTQGALAALKDYEGRALDVAGNIKSGMLSVFDSWAKSLADFVIEFDFSMDSVTNLFRAFADAVIAELVKIAAQAAVMGVVALIGRAFSGFFAEGGEITGPGGPREDKVLIAASAGEYVVNAAAYGQHRDLVRAINDNDQAAVAAAAAPYATREAVNDNAERWGARPIRPLGRRDAVALYYTNGAAALDYRPTMDQPEPTTAALVQALLADNEVAISAASVDYLRARTADPRDTVVAHLMPAEVEVLEALGGGGALNPVTGLRQYAADLGGFDGSPEMGADREPYGTDTRGDFGGWGGAGAGQATGNPVPLGPWAPGWRYSPEMVRAIVFAQPPTVRPSIRYDLYGQPYVNTRTLLNPFGQRRSLHMTPELTAEMARRSFQDRRLGQSNRRGDLERAEILEHGVLATTNFFDRVGAHVQDAVNIDGDFTKSDIFVGLATGLAGLVGGVLGGPLGAAAASFGVQTALDAYTGTPLDEAVVGGLGAASGVPGMATIGKEVFGLAKSAITEGSRRGGTRSLAQDLSSLVGLDNPTRTHGDLSGEDGWRTREVSAEAREVLPEWITALGQAEAVGTFDGGFGEIGGMYTAAIDDVLASHDLLSPADMRDASAAIRDAIDLDAWRAGAGGDMERWLAAMETGAPTLVIRNGMSGLSEEHADPYIQALEDINWLDSANIRANAAEVEGIDTAGLADGERDAVAGYVGAMRELADMADTAAGATGGLTGATAEMTAEMQAAQQAAQQAADAAQANAYADQYAYAAPWMDAATQVRRQGRDEVSAYVSWLREQIAAAPQSELARHGGRIALERLAGVDIMQEPLSDLEQRLEAARGHYMELADAITAFAGDAQIALDALSRAEDALRQEFVGGLDAAFGLLSERQFADQAAALTAQRDSSLRIGSALGVDDSEVLDRYNQAMAGLLGQFDEAWRAVVDGSYAVGEFTAALDQLHTLRDQAEAVGISADDAAIRLSAAITTLQGQFTEQLQLELGLAEPAGEWATRAQELAAYEAMVTAEIRQVGTSVLWVADQFTAARRQLADDFREEVGDALNPPDALGDYAAAMERLNATYRALIPEAEALGVSFDWLTQQRDAGVTALRARLSREVSEQIAQLEDPARATIDAIRREMEALRAEARSIGQSTSEIDRLEQLRIAAAMEQQLDTLAGAFNTQNAEVVSFVERMRSLGETLRDTSAQLRLDNSLSTLTPLERLNEAAAAWSSTQTRARLGDMDSLADLSQVSRDYLAAAQGYYASSTDYADIYARVQDSLTASADVADRHATTAADQLDVARQQLRALGIANSQLSALGDAINNLADLNISARNQEIEDAINSYGAGLRDNPYSIGGMQGTKTNQEVSDWFSREGYTGPMGAGAALRWAAGQNKFDDYLSYIGVSAFAGGGLAAPGVALVGEEGPELVRFAQPAHVYTAQQTRALLSTPAPAEPVVVHVDNAQVVQQLMVLTEVVQRLDQRMEDIGDDVAELRSQGGRAA